MNRQEAVKLENVTKRFGNVVAVNNVSFEVYKGELFSLLGPSGCGKTTTLRIISGLERPDEGRVYIEGTDVTELPARERRVCLVFQEYAVFPHMNVYENIEFGLKVKMLPRAERDKKVKEVAELLELVDYLNYKGGRLSLSDQQKVAIARCLVVEPKLLLLDEPLTLVDARVRERMRRELKRIQRELGTTMIYVTHDQLEALMLSDRMAVMRNGKIIQIGTPEEIYDNPADMFIATFVGSPAMNFLEGVLEVEEGMLILKTSSYKYVLSKSIESSAVQNLIGTEVVIGFRPEDAEVRHSGEVEGVIKLVEIVEDRKILHIKINEDEVKVLADIFTSFTEGQKVKVWINPLRLHIFEKKNGKKLLKGVVSR